MFISTVEFYVCLQVAYHGPPWGGGVLSMSRYNVYIGLFYKLKLLGIPSRFYSVLKNMYDKISLQVKIGSQLTPAFMSQLGVRQGDNLSPTLFNIFINDLPHQFSYMQMILLSSPKTRKPCIKPYMNYIAIVHLGS